MLPFLDSIAQKRSARVTTDTLLLLRTAFVTFDEAINKTILVIEHKVSKLEEFVDRLAVMHEGEIIACGECEATLNDPEVRQCYWKLET